MASPAELLGRLLRQGGVLAGAVLLGLLAGAMYGVFKTPAYTADAQVVVVNAASAPDDSTAVKFAQAYGRITTDSAVLAETPTIKAGGSVTALRGAVRAETSPDAPLVQVTATAPNAARAAQIANEVATALITFGNSRSAQTGARLASFASASAPDAPASPNKPVSIAVGAAAGLLIGGFATTAGVGGRRRRAAVPAAVPAATPATGPTHGPAAGSANGSAAGSAHGSASGSANGAAYGSGAGSAEPAPLPAPGVPAGTANGTNGVARGLSAHRLPAEHDGTGR